MLALEAQFPGDRMSARAVRDILRSASARVFVAERDGVFLGNLILLLPRRQRSARIYSVVVAPQARGQRIGEQLVLCAEKAARSEGRQFMKLEVRNDNVAAQALYRRLGYSADKALPQYYDDGADGVRLRKAL